jgi:hypothetical protein
MMKLSAWMPILLGNPFSVKQAQLPQQNSTSVALAKMDSFERSDAKPSRNNQVKVRSGSFLLDALNLYLSPKGIELLQRTEQEVVKTATKLGTEIANLAHHNLIDFMNPITLGMIIMEMDKRQEMSAFLLSFNPTAQNALREAAGNPELLTKNLLPFLADLQKKERMAWDTTGAILQQNYFSYAVSNGLGLVLNEGFHEVLPKFPRPLGYAIELPVPVPVVLKGDSRRRKYQANLRPMFNVETVSNAEQLARNTNLHQRALGLLDDTIYQMAVEKLSAEFVQPLARIFPHHENN